MKNFYKTLTCGTGMLVSAAVLAQVPAAIDGAYTIKYNTETSRTPVLEASKVAIGNHPVAGTLTIAESQGHLLYRTDVGGRLASALLYDGKNSFVYQDDTSALLRPGFAIDVLPVHVIFPFDFASYPVYSTLEFSVRQVDPVRLRAAMMGPLKGCNVGVFQGFNGPQAVLGPAILTNQSDRQRLTVPGTHSALVDAVFSKFTRLSNIGVPGTIVYDTYDKVDGQHEKGGIQILLTLHTATSSADPKIFAPESYLRKGMIISYSDGKVTEGIEYDPAKGTLEHQIDGTLAMTRTRNRLVENARRNARTPVAGFAVTGVFLCLTLYLVVKKAVGRVEPTVAGTAQ
jgi:hypothetical protein